MTPAAITFMAREAGAVVEPGLAPKFSSHAELFQFANSIAAAEREACAKVCDELVDSTEERRARALMIEAEKQGDMDRELSRGRHWLTVSTFNAGIKSCGKNIRARTAP